MTAALPVSWLGRK